MNIPIFLKKISLYSLIQSAFCFLSFSIQAKSLDSSIHKVLFLGNSITYAGNYITDIETYYFTHHPDHKIEFINLGLPSETVSGLSEPNHANGLFSRPDLHERLHRVLEKIKPDIVFACYGMNDGIYLPFDSIRFEKYREGMIWLHDTLLQATAARVIIVTPSVCDTLKLPIPFYPVVLDNYSNWLLQQKKSAGWEVADVHFPMQAYLAAHRKVDAAFHMDGFALSEDGVHPNETGHWFIAKVLLNYLGEKEVMDYANIRQAIAFCKKGTDILALITQKQNTMKDAWLTDTGHKRPQMNKGIPIMEARDKEMVINEKLRELIKD